VTDVRIPDEIAQLEAACEVRQTPCGSGNMVWRTWGAGANLVLLHGNLGSWQHWVRNIGFLARHFRVIAGDIPGFGNSALPPHPYSAQSLAQTIANGLLEITGDFSPLILAGFSFGSGVSAELAKILGPRIARYVMVSAGTHLHEVAPERLPEFTKWRGLPYRERLEAHRRNLASFMIADPANIDEQALYIQSESAVLARLNFGVINSAASHTNVTPHLKCGLAAIWGERDPAIGPNMHLRTRWLHGHHPDAPYIIIPKSGHWCMYETPEVFNAALLQLTSASN